jgi:hypothetical protein
MPVRAILNTGVLPFEPGRVICDPNPCRGDFS